MSNRTLEVIYWILLIIIAILAIRFVPPLWPATVIM